MEQNDTLERSILLKQLKEDKRQIMENKWYESEKAAHDVGLPFAISHWVIHHKTSMYNRYKSESNACSAESVSALASE